ncbi:DNA recombination protein RmuC [Pedobacter sp. UYP30]|uniref:DNA recombination protein RmuC n=1 Tax=Pedobacter sp. UYP30 TaxID=1756400 RepID=UPI0033966FDA
MDFLLILVGIFIGGFISYFIFNMLHKSTSVSKVRFEEINQQFFTAESNRQSLDNMLQQKIKDLTEVGNRNDFAQRENNLLTTENAVLKVELNTEREKLTQQKASLATLHDQNLLQFKEMANKILEEKSERFTQTNKVNLDAMLKPFGENIEKFSKQVNETYDKESKERFTLEKTVKDLIEQTDKVSLEANNLATALKGNTKKQGNWGEMILESILQMSGLVRDREYFLEQNQKGDEGINLRPDVLVKFPDNRVVIIDSKVSLLAYDRFVSADTPELQNQHLAEHIKAIRNHVDTLSGKKYDDHKQALDYTMLFMPIEPAYLLAIQTNPQIWDEAFKKRIILISPTNLIACLKLISNLWQRDSQSKNAQAIAKMGKDLYEKIVVFSKTFAQIGKQLQGAENAYQTALGQLNSGKGNLISKAIKFNELGIKSSAKIHENVLPANVDSDDYLEIAAGEEDV